MWDGAMAGLLWSQWKFVYGVVVMWIKVPVRKVDHIKGFENSRSVEKNLQ